jgi:hypothetical protein
MAASVTVPRFAHQVDTVKNDGIFASFYGTARDFSGQVKVFYALKTGFFLNDSGRFNTYYWSLRLESNQYPTLRRHVHYPLCYGEDARAAGGPAGQWQDKPAIRRS